MARSGKMSLECNECGKNFTSASMEPKCPKCGGYDVEPVVWPMPEMQYSIPRAEALRMVA